MSRAFTREIDDAPPEPPPERAISPHPNLVTLRGARLIEERVAEIEARITQAAPGEDALLRRDLRYWSARRASMQVVVPQQPPQAFGFGVCATIRRRGRLMHICCVGEDEADPAQGLISWTAPLARALDEAEPGESVEFEAGGSTEEIALVSIEGLAGT